MMYRKPKVTLAELQKSKRRVEKALGGISKLDSETVKRAVIQETIERCQPTLFEVLKKIPAPLGFGNAIAAKVKSRRAVSNKSRSVRKRLRSQRSV